MPILTDAYRAVFKKLRGKGFGLGIFNGFHRLVWEGFLQPEYVEVHGVRLYLPKHDEAIGDALRMQETFEETQERLLRERLGPGMTFLDLGANIGYYSVLGSRLVGPTGRVLAFEPDPANVALLVRNVQANGCANVEVYPYAVAESLGVADFHLCARTPTVGSLVLQHDGSALKRRAVTVGLDGFLEEACPDVVKMDIEGAELSALKGMRRLLADKRLRTMFVECVPQFLSRLGLSVGDVRSFIEPFGFRCEMIDPKNMLCTRS